MKKKEFTDLRKKLEAKKAKLNLISSKEKNLKIYRNIRRDIAQIETVIKEKQIIGKLQTK